MLRNSIFTLKNRIAVPPKGFRPFKNVPGFNSFKMAKAFSGKSEEEADRMIASVLAEEGHLHYVNECIPALNDQGVGEVFPIMSFLFPQVEDYHEDNYFFNPAITKHKGKIYMVVRRNREFADLILCELDEEDLQPKPETCVVLELPEKAGAKSNSWEDPRLYSFNGELMLSYGHWGHEWQAPYLPEVHLCEINDKTFKVRDDRVIPFGKNSLDTEKNWLFFQDFKDEPWCLYNANPQHCFHVQSLKDCQTPWQHKGWPEGLRGGTPPIKGPDDGLLYTFVRSHDFTSDRGKWSYTKRRYNVGCYAFEDVAPFRVVKYTPVPLLRASEQDPFLPSAPSVVFSSGAIWHNDQFVVSLGVHDMWSALWKVDMNVLNQEMIYV